MDASNFSRFQKIAVQPACILRRCVVIPSYVISEAALVKRADATEN
jgi:hypothetical protein